MLDPSQAPDFGQPALPEVQPPIPPRQTGMQDHSEHFGWLADGSELGYCMLSGGSGGTLCEFFAPNAKRTAKLDDLDAEALGPDPKRTAQINRRIARYSVPRVPWAFARDLVLTWRSAPSKGEGGPPAKLQFGARVRGSSAEALPISIVAGPYFFEVHVEAWGFSPDASSLAVQSHAFGGEFTDTFEVRVVIAAKLAGEAYNSAGLALHRRADYAAAAPLFHKAAFADPSAKLPMYNLACALARLKDAGAAKALELALARGGAEVVEKARHDADFDAVRTDAWFTALIDAGG